MAQLGKLVRARTQMVFLTATLPPEMEPEFSQRIHHPQDQIDIYRARTSRGNVAYGVWRPLIPHTAPHGYGWEQDARIIQFLQAQLQWARARGGKMVIYANRVHQVQAMAAVLGCEAYFSGQVDRGGILGRFMGGDSTVLCATSALGMGVDIPNIRVIIHLGTPRTLLD